MRKLSRIILINAAGFDYVEFPVGGHSQVIGVNGHGKSTLLRTVLFFYLGSNEKAPYALYETKMDFVSYYLGDPPSYLVYEVSRGSGEPNFHIAVTRPSGRIQFQFIDAPFNKEYFVDGSYVRPLKEVLEALREAKCPSETVVSYDEFNHRIYGVVTSPYSVFRPAPRSSGHVGILARIISGIFTVSQLDADKLKSALTCGVRQDSLSTELDLALLKSQLQNFRRVNNAVKTYIRYENEASELVNLAEQFETVKCERQHAIEDLVRMTKKLPEELHLLADQQTALEKERSAAIERFNLANAALGRAIQGLGEQIAVLKSGITKGETTGAEYRKREIDRKSKELEKLPVLTEERRVAQDEYDILTAKYSSEQDQKSRLLATVQQAWTQISRQLADKRGACERESRQNLEDLDKNRRQALTAIAEERKEAKAAFMPRQKAAQIDRATLNQEFRALADVKEPTELSQIKKTLEEKDRQQRDEANRQDQLRNKIAAAKVKTENDRERLERDAQLERSRLESSIKQLEAVRDQIANELEKFDLSLASFFQIESPQTWPDAAKTLSRDTLFQSAVDLAAKKSKGNSASVWGVELSAAGLPDQHESYNRETLAATLQKAKVSLANEHDKLEAARSRYMVASSEIDKLAVQTRTGLETEIAASVELRRTLLDAAIRLDNRRLTLESQFADDKRARRDKLNSREEAVDKEERILRQEELELDARCQIRENKVNEDFDAMRKSFADDILRQIAAIEKEEQAAEAHRDEEIQRIERAFQQKLTAQGVSSKLIQSAETKAAQAHGEIQRISNYQAEVTEHHAADADEFLEVPRDELRAVVADDPGAGLGIVFLGALQDGFDVGLLHLLADFPMHDGAAAAVQGAAQVVKSAADVDVGNVHMPMLVRGQRLDKAGSFLGWTPVSKAQQPGLGQHPIDAGRADGHHVGIEHHEGQAAVAFQRVLLVKVNDRLLLPILQPVVAGNPAIMLVGLAVAAFPVEELAARQAGPAHQARGRDFGLVRPAPHEIHDLVAQIVRHPFEPQLSPRLFFNATCSSMSSASTLSLRASFSSRAVTLRSKAVEGLSARLSKTRLPRSKNSCCQR
jgi:hypothetical protein